MIQRFVTSCGHWDLTEWLRDEGIDERDIISIESRASGEHYIWVRTRS